MRTALGLFIVAVILSGIVYALLRWTPTREALGIKSHWQPLAPGMEVRTLRCQGESGMVEVTVVRADPAQCTPRIVTFHKRQEAPSDRAEAVCPPVGAAINASLFDEKGVPLGLLVIDGKSQQPLFPRDDWGGVFLLRNGRPEIIKSGAPLPKGVTQALECKPRLVVDGQIPSFKSQAPARRSAVGIDTAGHLILAASVGLLTLDEWAAFLRNSLHCTNALNLDGGSSTQLAVRGPVPATISGAPVPTFLVIAPNGPAAR